MTTDTTRILCALLLFLIAGCEEKLAAAACPKGYDAVASEADCVEFAHCKEIDGQWCSGCGEDSFPCFTVEPIYLGTTCVPQEDPKLNAACGPAEAAMICRLVGDAGVEETEGLWELKFDCEDRGGVCNEALLGSTYGGCEKLPQGAECLITNADDTGPLMCAAGLDCVGQNGSSPGICQ